MFLELFAGAGVLTKALRRQGYAVLPFDVANGADQDLLHPTVLSTIEGWLSAGIVTGVWLGTPCTTWSIAHTTPIVRTDAYPYGVPGLPPKHAAAVKMGNRTMLVTRRIIKRCIQLRVPAFLENPASSRLFRVTPIASLAQPAQNIVCDYSQFGMRWRKHARVLAWHACDCSSLNTVCSGRHGMCSRTHCPHIALQGKPTGSSKSWTAIASPYPAQFARTAAHLLATSHSNLVQARAFQLGLGC